jgi:hypothetical protein
MRLINLKCNLWVNSMQWRRQNNGSLVFAGQTPSIYSVVGDPHYTLDFLKEGSRPSRYGQSFTPSKALTLVFYPDSAHGDHLTLCEMGTQYVESSIACTKQSDTSAIPCFVTRMRGIPGYDQHTNLTAFDISQNYMMLQYIPYTLASYDDNENGFIEKWLLNPPNALQSGFGTIKSQYKTYDAVPLEIFSNRLAMVLNTHLHASLNLSILLGDNEITPATADYRWQNSTADWSEPITIYRVRRSWFVLFTISTAVLAVCAVANLVLRCMIRVPDFLGSVSALTRDSPFVHVQTPASTADGVERTLLLRDRRVVIGDVQPENPVGRIALSDAPGTIVRLKPGRKYE